MRSEGAPVAVIAERFGITPFQVEYVCRDLPRHKPVPRRRSTYEQLNDPGWLRVEFALGGGIYGIAQQLGCDRSAVRAALVRHNIEPPPTTLSAFERIEALSDPAERAAAAARVEAEALATADQATKIKVAALRQVRRSERPTTA